MSGWLWAILHPIQWRDGRRYRRERLAHWTPERIAELQREIRDTDGPRTYFDQLRLISDDPVIWDRADRVERGENWQATP